ncbi:MAG: response regulator, partial [Cyanobacteria bacterium J06576_12]
MSASLQLPTWRVLIIEDDPLVQLGIEQALAKYPELTVVDTIDDGYLAVESALQHQPDLLLMDIGLPGIDGIETTRPGSGDKRPPPRVPFPYAAVRLRGGKDPAIG